MIRALAADQQASSSSRKVVESVATRNGRPGSTPIRFIRISIE
jgi:hypothetical protein